MFNSSKEKASIFTSANEYYTKADKDDLLDNVSGEEAGVEVLKLTPHRETHHQLGSAQHSRTSCA